MKNKFQLTTIVNGLITAILSMLGFSSCGGEAAVEYGTPYGKFQVSGLVKNENAQPLKDVRVITRKKRITDPAYSEWVDSNDFVTGYYCDTTYTNASGYYIIDDTFYTGNGSIEMVVEDPSQNYISTFRIIQLKFDGGHGWDKGSCTLTENFQLAKFVQTD